MGTYSTVMIAVTKRDFKKIENDQVTLPGNMMSDVDKQEYKKNSIDCVFMMWESIRYYKEYEEVQVLEKSLRKLKDGYVFCRLGEEIEDIDFRKRSKLPELMMEFDFIRKLSRKLNKELKKWEENEFE